MNSRERLLAAIRREKVDKVPANVTYYMPAFSQAHFPLQPGQDRWEAHLQSYLKFGFDPLMGVGGGQGQPWQLHRPGRWTAHQEAAETVEGIPLVTYTIDTPGGSLSTIYRRDAGFSGWLIEPFIKEEDDLAALKYLPEAAIDTAAIVRQLDRLDGRGLGYVSINGIWQQACYLRGMAQMAMDLYDRPCWAERFLGLLADWLAAQTLALSRSSAEAFFINESYLGLGMSSAMFEEFVRPFDQRFVEIAKGAGKLVLYHECGRINALLEGFADMGIDYLEPVNPRAASGDIEPEEVKRRIGDRVCLRGGFNHELMSTGRPQDIEEEVKRCLAKLAPGGGYILCPAGPIQPETPLENLTAFSQAAQEYCGQYGG